MCVQKYTITHTHTHTHKHTQYSAYIKVTNGTATFSLQYRTGRHADNKTYRLNETNKRLAVLQTKPWAGVVLCVHTHTQAHQRGWHRNKSTHNLW